MDIRPVGAKLFHADKQKDRQTERNDEADITTSWTRLKKLLFLGIHTNLHENIILSRSWYLIHASDYSFY
jgi:hypothetical protein